MEAGFSARVTSETRPFGEVDYFTGERILNSPKDCRRLAGMILDIHDDAEHEGVARFCRWAACREAALWT